jgi:hypothetical protein
MSRATAGLTRQPPLLVRLVICATVAALCVAGAELAPASRPSEASSRPAAGTRPTSTGRVDAAAAVPPAVEKRPRLVYANDFSSPAALDPAQWNVYDGPGNAGYGLRRPSAITVDGHGHLVITATMRAGQVVSGGMALRSNQLYGRYVVRVRTEADPSGVTNGVVLTWPQANDFPVGGESDMYETGPNPTRNFFSTHIHYSAHNHQVSFRTFVDATQWQTVVMVWTASRIAVYDNGRLVAATSDPAVVPHVPQHLCLQLDDAHPGRLTRPVHMYVDSVAVYALR